MRLALVLTLCSATAFAQSAAPQPYPPQPYPEGTQPPPPPESPPAGHHYYPPAQYYPAPPRGARGSWPPPSAQQVEELRQRGLHKKIVGGVMLGVGVVSLVTSIALFVSNDYVCYNQTPNYYYDSYDDHCHAKNSGMLAGAVISGLAGVGLSTAGAITLAVGVAQSHRASRAAPRVSLAPALAPTQAGLRLAVTF